MADKKVNYSAILKRLRNRKLTELDYEVLGTELEKVVSATGKAGPGGRRIVAQLPFGMDIVK